MLINVRAEEILRTFGLTEVTYFPVVSGAHIHEETARFLSDVGVPSNSFFSPRVDPEDPNRFSSTPGLRSVFESEGVESPQGTEGWEVLGELVETLVAIDPKDGRIYAFPGGDEVYHLLHADISSLVHTLTVVEQGKAAYKGLPRDDDYRARTEVVDRLRRRIADVDETPFADADSEWNRLFEEITLGMWG